ncbi:permease [Halobacillus litoralis]|uniref:permease n=1 Tax=Halobacillus litoralis TaxID=45668 RepID=UPI001F4F59A1|nr:permease [Halobacillus litoralis]
MKDYYPRTYGIVGGLFSLQAVFLLFVSLMAKSAPPMITYMMISMAILAFSMSYLHPQFRQKDERMKMIRYKGLFYSFFAMMGYLSLLLLLMEFNIMILSAEEVVQLLIALNMSTVFLSWVVLSKKY